MKRTIVWFRGKDLRVSDHAPLRAAVADGEVIPLFVLEPQVFASRSARGRSHSMQFLLDSLVALESALAERGSRLVVVAGNSVEVLPRLVRQWKVDGVVAQRSVEPYVRGNDRLLSAALGSRFQLYEGETVLPPGALRTGSGTPYLVFTPFARAFHQALLVGRPLEAPTRLGPLPSDLVREHQTVLPTLQSLGIDLNPRVLAGGEAAAQQRLQKFLKKSAKGYAEQRDRMDLAGTSRLSADLKFGTLSPRQVWTSVENALGGMEGARSYLNELVWREFAHSLLWDRPELLQRPFRPAFEQFPWSGEDGHWKAWAAGTTGYPVVDAAARQLLSEGFVHNRARMISASFLCKHLLVDYRRGEAHYLKYLTDGDSAQNNAGWQWSAGCGCDAQPYFRIFHPVAQGKRFDPDGDYVRRWVPELAKLPARFIHNPWEAPEAVLRGAGVRLDETYPRPIVEHRAARQRFLDVASRHFKLNRTRRVV